MNNEKIASELVSLAKELKAANLIDEQEVDERLSEISKKMHVLTRAAQNNLGKNSLTRKSNGVMGNVYGLAEKIKADYSGKNQYRGMGESNGAMMLSISQDLSLILNLLERIYEAQKVYDKEVATLMNRINSKMTGIL